MAEKIAIFPGTFDPFTLGHLNIVSKSLNIFDKVIVAIGHNATKKNLFSVEQRLKWINIIFNDETRVFAEVYTGLTYEYCVKKNADFIIRGLRSSLDFEYEKQIAFVNEFLNKNILNVFLISDHDYNSVSSTIVRDLIIHKGDFTKFIPSQILSDLAHK
ncbi:MAG: pantetheine-phosphate adenylyltransferase [Bacteroidia bacterium]|nr:pantetheine-phosphate adenylyltransferase [Bacteroidia bacterium]